MQVYLCTCPSLTAGVSDGESQVILHLAPSQVGRVIRTVQSGGRDGTHSQVSVHKTDIACVELG